MEEERREHVAKMKKMEMEMEQVFEMKVKEKVQKLKDSEAEVNRHATLFKITVSVKPTDNTICTLKNTALMLYYMEWRDVSAWTWYTR